MKKYIYCLTIFIACICSLHGQNKVPYLRTITYKKSDGKSDSLIFTIKNISDSSILVVPFNTYGNSISVEKPEGQIGCISVTNCENLRYKIETKKEKSWTMTIDFIVEYISDDLKHETPLLGLYKVIWEFNNEKLNPFIFKY